MTASSDLARTGAITAGRWRVDPERSEAGFAVGSMWGLTNRRRDRHLRSPDFLDTERHPRILFSLTGLTAGERRAMLGGTLRLGARELPLELAMTLDRLPDDALRLHGTTTISRTAAGLAWNRLGMIGDEITVDAHVTLLRDG